MHQLNLFFLIQNAGDDSDLINLPGLQILGWQLSIFLWFLALHAIVTVILTELMGRTYRKPWLWFIIAFFLPIIGPISILLYHLLMSATVSDARKQSFWERILFGGPVSLQKLLWKEKALAEEAKLMPLVHGTAGRAPNQPDKEIDKFISEGKFGEARGHALKMLDITMEVGDTVKQMKYQEYLEIIAEKQAEESGTDIGTGN